MTNANDSAATPAVAPTTLSDLDYIKDVSKRRVIFITRFSVMSDKCELGKAINLANEDASLPSPVLEFSASGSIMPPEELSKLKVVKSAVYAYMTSRGILLGRGGCYSIPAIWADETAQFLSQKKDEYNSVIKDISSRYAEIVEKQKARIRKYISDPATADAVIRNIPSREEFLKRNSCAFTRWHMYIPTDEKEITATLEDIKQQNNDFLNLLADDARNLIELFNDSISNNKELKVKALKSFLFQSKKRLNVIDLALRGDPDYDRYRELSAGCSAVSRIVTAYDKEKFLDAAGKDKLYPALLKIQQNSGCAVVPKTPVRLTAADLESAGALLSELVDNKPATAPAAPASVEAPAAASSPVSAKAVIPAMPGVTRLDLDALHTALSDAAPVQAANADISPAVPGVTPVDLSAQPASVAEAKAETEATPDIPVAKATPDLQAGILFEDDEL